MAESLVTKYKKEFKEIFAERKEKKTRQAVFDILSDIESLDEQINAVDLQKAAMVEKKEKLEAKLAALDQ